MVLRGTGNSPCNEADVKGEDEMSNHRTTTRTQRDTDDRIGFGGFSLTVEQILSLTAEQLAKVIGQDRYAIQA